eukprot:3000821-Rhodomonas_salina.1
MTMLGIINMDIIAAVVSLTPRDTRRRRRRQRCVPLAMAIVIANTTGTHTRHTPYIPDPRP